MYYTNIGLHAFSVTAMPHTKLSSSFTMAINVPVSNESHTTESARARGLASHSEGRLMPPPPPPTFAQ